MLVKIGSYEICNGTLGAGLAVSGLRIKADRLFEFIVPVGNVDCELFNRVTTTIDLIFVVKITHATKHIAEKFILGLDSNIPTSGVVLFTTTGPSPFTRVIPNGYLLDHELLQELGATTFHQYHITGGPPVAP